MATERVIDVRGQRIWTESTGDPANTPILFISGAGAHAHFWTDSFCDYFLQAGYFVIRYDHRDCGLSQPTESDFELEDLVDDAIGILNAYNISAAHIIGHSMGGYIGQLMAASYPDRMLSLTCISAGPVGETESVVRPYTNEEKMLVHQTWLVLMRNRPKEDFETSYEGFRGVWERLNGLAPVDDQLARQYTQEMYTRSRYPVGGHQRHLKAMQKMAKTLGERTEIFSKITLPMLIVHGKEDYLVPPPRGGEALAEVLPHAQLAIISKMGHMLFNFEIEKVVAEKIVAFLP